MKLTKHVLREAARRVLERRGDLVSPKPGAGIVPGARLTAEKAGSKPRTVSVRTSVDRELGLMRNERGRWRTISKVDEVLVAVPSDDKTSVEVMSFDPNLLKEIFDEALNKRPNLKKDYRLPLFIPLDDKRLRRTGAVTPGLKEKSQWQEIITPDEEMLRKGTEQSSARGFIERVKREFAEINGVDVSKVIVEFRIVA
jgi:hypothetical protein